MLKNRWMSLEMALSRRSGIEVLQGLRAFRAVSLQNRTRIDWRSFDEHFGAHYRGGKGRPAISTRLTASLHYLKYTHDLSDEAVVRGWVENPHWQHLSGMEFFRHEPPIDPSSMSRWRRRVGEAGGEKLSRETIETGLRLGVIKPSELARVNVDTTVQEKRIRFPTDARLYDRMRQRLVKAAREEGVDLRQSYARVGKTLLAQQGRHAHAKQFKRARRCARRLRTILGGVIRDIKRKCATPSGETEELLTLARRLHLQKRRDKGKLHSVHARRWSASRRARLINAASSAAKSPSPRLPKAGGFWRRALWRATLTTATPCKRPWIGSFR